MKLPAIQFYVGDWMKDPAVRSVSLAARGLWIDMLCLMHESDRRGFLQHATGKPVTAEQLARMVGCFPDEVSRLLQELETSGVFSSERGVMFSRRMVRDESKRVQCVEAGKKGGNPTLKRTAKGKDNPHANPPDGAPEDEGEDEGEDESEKPDLSSLPSAIYAAYPRHVGPRKAMAEIANALNRIANGEAKKPPDIPEWPPPNPAAWLLDRTKQYAEATASWPADERQYIPHPSTFFHQDRYCDDPKQWQRNSGTRGNHQAAGSGASRPPARTAADRGEFASDPGDARRY